MISSIEKRNLQKIDQHPLERIPRNIEEIKPPLDAFPNNRDGIGIKERGNINKQVVHSHSLCSRLIRKTFDWVKRLQGCVSETVGDSKEVDCGDGGAGTILVGVAAFTVDGCEHGYGGPDDDEHGGCDEEDGATAETVGEAGADCGHYEGNNVENGLVELKNVLES